MINLNVNRIEARLNRPGPNLITPVNYLVIGGGNRGSATLGDNGAQSGELKTGTISFQHGTSLTFEIGRGRLGINSTTTGLSSTAASSSFFTYTPNLLTVEALPGSGSGIDCNPGSPDDIYPCNSKGTWVHDPSTYQYWAQDGGKSYDVPATGDDEYGSGGGQEQPGPGGIQGDFPWPTNRGDVNGGELSGAFAYNGSGGGGGAGYGGAVPGFSGDGADGVVGFAIYDPNEIFVVEYTAPTRSGADVAQEKTLVNWNGYRIWYFHGTYSNGTFTLIGRKQ